MPGRPGKPVRLHPPGLGPDGRPKASWRVTFHDERDRPRERTAVGRAAAVLKAEELVAELSATVRAPSAASTVADLAAVYLTEYGDARDWAPKYRKERWNAHRWLPQDFLALPCHRWSVRDSERVLRDVAAAGYPRGCEEYRRVGALLSGLGTAGRRYGYLSRDQQPMQDVEYNPDRRTRRRDSAVGARDAFRNVRPVEEFEVPTRDQVRALAWEAARLTGCWWEELRVLLFAMGGLRYGESVDLRTRCVVTDPERPCVWVLRQAVEVSPAPVPGGATLLTDQPPKHGIVRAAWYDEDIIPLFDRRLEELEDEDGRCGHPDGALVLPSPTGLPYRSSNYLGRVWSPAARSLGWARVENMRNRAAGSKRTGWLWTPHSLRHLYATHAIRDLRIEVPLVSEWMGHGDVRVTQQMYVDRSRPNVTAGVRAVREARSRDVAAVP